MKFNFKVVATGVCSICMICALVCVISDKTGAAWLFGLAGVGLAALSILANR